MKIPPPAALAELPEIVSPVSTATTLVSWRPPPLSALVLPLIVLLSIVTLDVPTELGELKNSSPPPELSVAWLPVIREVAIVVEPTL
jgi:hypothetical protein